MVSILTLVNDIIIFFKRFFLHGVDNDLSFFIVKRWKHECWLKSFEDSILLFLSLFYKSSCKSFFFIEISEYFCGNWTSSLRIFSFILNNFIYKIIIIFFFIFIFFLFRIIFFFFFFCYSFMLEILFFYNFFNNFYFYFFTKDERVVVY